ncbi:MAG: hypothetical protein JWM86_1811, partial [Thermoleophilia bacterium]|nr:hypothetical protein [Thermoleophilia bacterium]
AILAAGAATSVWGLPTRRTLGIAGLVGGVAIADVAVGAVTHGLSHVTATMLITDAVLAAVVLTGWLRMRASRDEAREAVAVRDDERRLALLDRFGERF